MDLEVNAQMSNPAQQKAEEKKLAKPRLVSKRPASVLRKPAASGKRPRLEPLPEGVVAGCSKCKYKASRCSSCRSRLGI